MSYITLIIGLIALIAALPFALKFFIYILYRPKFEIDFYPTDYEKKGEITDLNIRSLNKKSLDIDIRLILDKPGQVKEEVKNYIKDAGLVGGAKRKGRFWYKLVSFHSAGYSLLGFPFPLEFSPDKCSIEIIIYPKVHLSEFRFPMYFGDVDLKPVRQIFSIESRPL